jgi:signal transduction histidine kinase
VSQFGAYIEVLDNGKGISAEYLGKIFEMFFRASEDSYGSGLGLYITKQVVEKLQGKIEVESVFNEGTTFKVWLPHLVKRENGVLEFAHQS